MESGVSDNASRPLRRSKRRSSVLSYEPTPRGPLRRTRKGLENRPPAAVNGSRDIESGSEEEETPEKKRRLEKGDEVGGSGDEMEVQESVEEQEKNENQDMEIGQDSSHGTLQPNICQDALGDVNLSPRVVPGERCPSGPTVDDTKRVIPSTKRPVASTKPDVQIKSPGKDTMPRHNVSKSKDSMDENMRTMKPRSSASSLGIPAVNLYVLSGNPATEKYYTTPRLNNIPTRKETSQPKKQGVNKPAVIKKNSEHSSRGFKRCVLPLVFLVMLSTCALLMAHKNILAIQRAPTDGNSPTRAVKPEMFADHVSLLETQFPNQRPEVWKRSKIHLEKHLKTEQPKEPVSLIFAAGRRAERTLHCLAQGLASSFSSALNASILHIDGARTASQDSDEVKMDIDSQLQAAFEGDKPAAVIHRFEELPPGSTLIFYRYCDHETAAYKRAFLLFTVLLPEDEISSRLSLKEVEEMVHDYVKEKLVGSSNQTAFNMMDTDKYGGLWSRISHLILPVVSETEVEQKGCP